MEFSMLSTVDLGPRYWKFNTSHLTDPSFCEQLNSFWLHWRSQKHCYSSFGAWWDAGKVKLKKTDSRLANGEDVEAFLREAKLELEIYLLKQAKGAQVRAHIQWAEDGKRSTSFFFRQEKTHSSRSIITSISRPDGSFATKSQASQTGGIPGRLSAENICLLKDIVLHANDDVSAAILSLDQEKAFDRVEWSFLTKVLGAMGFGLSFQQWVRLFYTNIGSSVIVNGFISTDFNITHGVRQGCPLSPLLYVLVIEALAITIQKDPEIDWYPLPDGTQQKVCQYADDTMALVTSDHSTTKLFSTFTWYEKTSGAKFNLGKCHGLLIGSWRGRSVFPVDLDWTNEAIVTLGSRISNDSKENWAVPLKKYEDLLISWKQCSLSFRGHTLIVSALGLSLFWYLATFESIPQSLVVKINGLSFPYIWGKKREWLAHTSVMQPIKDGGLGAVDVDKKTMSLHCL
ncbi:Hypothetical predicted protein [Paramuricea clavata]|uniref:Uncharacterized protein n=1 Tax=Paramuricea clavata TaxID=317549 RepID=A0A7D9IUH0_PARCT|nr:Hypothetical predicted protein [Paramuricea clavata]